MSAKADTARNLLSKLSPEERLRVLADALPDTAEAVLDGRSPEGASATTSANPVAPPRSVQERLRQLEELRGLWKGMGFDISDEDIAEARREMWGNFPRDDF